MADDSERRALMSKMSEQLTRRQLQQRIADLEAEEGMREYLGRWNELSEKARYAAVMGSYELPDPRQGEPTVNR